MTEADRREMASVYHEIKERIEERLFVFKSVWERGREDEIFSELIFCILTPAARARSAWECLEHLKKKNLLMHGAVENIAVELNLVRFKNNKARNIIEARKYFCTDGNVGIKEAIIKAGKNEKKREWLAATVRGIGYKEASHFLRNIGYTDYAILDFHIIDILARYGLIEKPKTLTKKRYLEIERLVKKLARKASLNLAELDLFLWYMETGKVLK